jgi:hypothetical protein
MPLDLNDAPEQRPEGDVPTQHDWKRETAELIASLRLTARQWVPALFHQGKIDHVKKELRVADITGRPPRNKGSCVIQLAGEHAGSFNDFGTKESGSPISTIARHFGISSWRDAKEAATEIAAQYGYQARRRTGGSGAKRSTSYKAATEAAEASNRERDERRENNIKEASFELGRSVPAAGTLVETYFAARGMTLPATDDLRFGDNVTHRATNTGKPALLAVIRHPDGTPTGGIHRIYLKDDGSGHIGDKMMLGPVDGVVMLAPVASDGTLGIAEGIETASAAMQLTGVPCWSTLSAGGMRKLGAWLVANPDKLGTLGIKRLIIFADAGEAGEDAAAYLQAHATAAGIAAVEVHLPRGGDDFADDLAKGLEAPVIDAPVEPDEPVELVEPEPIVAPAFAAPIALQDYNEILMFVLTRLADDAVGFSTGRMVEYEVEKEIHRVEIKKHRDIVANWPKLDFNPPPPVPPDPTKPMAPAYMITGAPGTGKTRLWIEMVAIPAIKMGHHVIISASRLELADEIAKIFADKGDKGIDAAVYRGRKATDPQASPKARMCPESERVELIDLALAPIDQKACKTKDHECQFYQTCGYQRQKKLKPKVWIVTHQLLFYERPDFIPDHLQLAIEEAFHGQSLRGVDKPYSITLQELRKHRPIYTDSGQLDAGATADLRDFSDRIANAIAAGGLGRISRSALIEVGITADNAVTAAKLEWRRKKDLDVYPGMEIEKVDERSKAISADNQQVARLTQFFKLIARTIQTEETDKSLWLEMRLNNDSERAIFMIWRMDIHDTWNPLGSTAILNAATRQAVVRPFFPHVAALTMHSVAMPHTHVTQIVDKAMTERFNLKYTDDIRHYIEVRADETSGRVLVVCQESVEAALRKAFAETPLFPMPANLEIAHFNNLSGLNKWQYIELLIVIGRTEPPPRDLEKLARAFFEREVIEVQPDEHGRVWYTRGLVGIRMRDGSVTKVIGHEHPDWRVETLRWLICVAELAQAVGRGRGVRRTAANPLQIELLCNVVLPIEVDEVRTWEGEGNIQPPKGRVMGARGIAPDNYRDMHALHSKLFKSSKAAEHAMRKEAREAAQAMQREGLPFPLYGSLLPFFLTYKANGRPSALAALPYRRAGRGQQPTLIRYDPAKYPDIEAVLTKYIGPVIMLGPPEVVEIPTWLSPC